MFYFWIWWLPWSTGTHFFMQILSCTSIHFVFQKNQVFEEQSNLNHFGFSNWKQILLVYFFLGECLSLRWKNEAPLRISNSWKVWGDRRLKMQGLERKVEQKVMAGRLTYLVSIVQGAGAGILSSKGHSQGKPISKGRSLYTASRPAVSAHRSRN